jgi:tetratricopeptide (TPR) repeat protein
MSKKDEKDVCDNPPEIIIPQHPDCNPEFSECSHDNKIAIDLVPGECATRGADPHFTKGYELYHEGMMDEALVELDESAKVNPDISETYLIMGDIYERRRMFDEALREYEKALKLSPNDKMMRFKRDTAAAQRTSRKS